MAAARSVKADSCTRAVTGEVTATAPVMAPRRSEELPAQRLDRCITDAIVKLGGGIVVGSVFSLLLFRRRSWPIIMGAGAGLGMAYNSCEISLNELFSSSHTDKVDPDTGEFRLKK